MDKKELERKKTELIAKGVGYILGYLVAVGFYLFIIAGLNIAVIGALSWFIFWCFGWEWNILIPIGVYALSLLLRFITRRFHG